MPANDQDQDNETRHGPNLILDVENFGPIAEAKNIEFRPMTVFVGPSNTGKSYLARLLHAMLQAHRNWHYVPPASYLRRLMPHGAGNDDVALFEETVGLLMNAKEYDVESDGISISIDDYSATVKAQIFELLDQWKRDIAKSYTNEITEFFEVEHLNDLRRGFGQTDAQLSVRLGDAGLGWHVTPGIETFTDSNDIRLAFRGRTLTRLVDSDVRDGFASLSINRALLDALVRKFDGVVDSLYFPAARTGILTGHKTTTRGFIEHAHQLGVDDEEEVLPIYDRVARDFLRLINGVVDAEKLRRRRSNGETEGQIASRIESAVLQGQVRIEDRQYGPPDFQYAPVQFGPIRLPIFRASSMVTELAPMVAFLRAYVEIGDLLIIEEPEAHLHPAAQQRMAAILAYMVQQGIRVLITTHSHYMVEAMGMFTCAAGIDGVARVRSMGDLLGDDGDATDDISRQLYLNEGEVGIYSFDAHDDGGTIVSPVPFDTRSYTYAPRGYSDALVGQFNRISRVINERIRVDELAKQA